MNLGGTFGFSKNGGGVVINQTPITDGAASRVLFQNVNGTVGQSGNLTYNGTTLNTKAQDASTSAVLNVEHWTNGSSLFRVLGNGNVGIGITNPNYNLDIQNPQGGGLVRIKDSDSPYLGIVITGDINGGWIGNNNGLTSEGIYYQNNLNLLRIFTNSVERMRINSSGNIGIGTTSPTAKLHVRAQDASTTAVLNVEHWTNGSSLFRVLGNGSVFSNGGGGIITNTAYGEDALLSNSTGNHNTAYGLSALRSNTLGISNTANGAYALSSNTAGGSNTANGFFAMQLNTTGGSNTANGTSALRFNTTGSQNIANGVNAGRLIANGSNLTVSNQSLFLGADTRALNDNSINELVLGFAAVGNGNNTVTIGNDSIVTTVLKGNVGIRLANPTARLQLPAGTATAGTAPIKLTAGVLLSIPENLALETDGINLYFTVGGVRKIVTLL